MDQFLNYHHLRYFHAIAKEGNLTRAAEHLHVSQSALSLQLKKLEESLGHALFLRQNKRLVLTEAGKITLDYAEMIFKSGQELLGTLQRDAGGPHRVLRVGAVSTLSRNFLHAFLKPVIERDDCEVVVQSGGLQKQLERLKAHTVDIVLSNFPVTRDAHTGWHSHLLDEQSVSLVGKPRKPTSKGKRSPKWSYPDDLRDARLVLPSLESNIRVAFDLVMDSQGIHPHIMAEVDDMALLRLFARESNALTLVPPVVVQDELKAKTLIEYHRFDEIHESFYAISPSRKFPDPLSRELIARWATRGRSNPESVRGYSVP